MSANKKVPLNSRKISAMKPRKSRLRITCGVKLYIGNVDVVGRKLDNSLFDENIATFDDDSGAYYHKNADGFIKLNTLRLRMQASRRN